MNARSLQIALLVSTGLCVGMGCTTVFSGPGGYHFFADPDPTDVWSPKISGWQRREAAEAETADVADSGDSDGAAVSRILANAHANEGGSGDGAADGLRPKYFRFRAERRREIAREFAEWIQTQARNHYEADGATDHWATFEETMRSNGDDCDGLELLVYHGLRDLGFSEAEVYRAIVYRPSDGQHHMVTLWFEDPGDPWVLDPTGAMTSQMVLMSDLPSWVPLKVFSETTEYTVRRERRSQEARLAASR